MALAHFNLGEIDRQSGDAQAAIGHFKKTIELNPANVDAYNNLAGLQLAQGDFVDALRSMQKLLEMQPRSAQGYLNLGVALRMAGGVTEAIRSYENALILDPSLSKAMFELSSLYATVGDFDKAEDCLRRLRELGLDDHQANVAQARLFERQGELESAAAEIEIAYAESPLDPSVAIVYANIQEQLGNTDTAIEALEKIVESRETLAEEGIGLMFSLGKLYDSREQYDKAFECFYTGNSNRKKGMVTEFVKEIHEDEVDRLIEAYSPARYPSMPRATVRTELPIFILGMPRSGTSLVEQIVAHHPDVHGGGELSDIRDLIRSTYPETAENNAPGIRIIENEQVTDYHIPADMDSITVEQLNELGEKYLDTLRSLGGDAERVTDKMPYNFYVVGFLNLLFPEAPIIHCCRHPIDTCLSCYFQNFFRGNYQSFDLEHLGAYYQGYERIMAHWQDVLQIPMLNVQYEELVHDPEPNVRRILDYCNLDWDDRCLQFHTSKRVIDTASYQQVRKPIYTKSVNRWKRYEKHIGPLIESLGLERAEPYELAGEGIAKA